MSSSLQRVDFQTTCWTQVLEAANRGQRDNQSLEALCNRYWYPLYAYLRRVGYDSNNAEDLVQGFFVELLERNSLELADPNRGKFRSFLLAACKNFVSNQQRHGRTLRRGGGVTVSSLNIGCGEDRYLHEPADVIDAQKLFDRRWALETIEAALEELRLRYQAAGKEHRFLVLKQLLAPASLPPSHADLAEQLGMTEGAVKVAAHRLRHQFAAALRDQVAATVDLSQGLTGDQQLVDAELQELLKSLS